MNCLTCGKTTTDHIGFKCPAGSVSAEVPGCAAELADKLYNWLSDQKYGDEHLLHAAVCCDHVGKMRFKKKIAEIIDAHLRAA